MSMGIFGRQHGRAPKTRGDGACVMIHIREEQRKCEEGVRTTTSSLTLILVSLDCVVTHVDDNEGCVPTRWDRIDADSWARAFPAHQNQRQ